MNQDMFRIRVLASYGNRRYVTGLGMPGLLRASHTKPWRDCNGNLSWRRMDVRNALRLNALHNMVFDEYYIGIDEDMKIMFYPSIHDYYNKELRSKPFLSYEGKRINESAKMPAGEEYFAYHRNVFFIKS